MRTTTEKKIVDDLLFLILALGIAVLFFHMG